MPDTRTPKEVIYDEQMAPLITQLIQIAQEHKIALLLDADIGEVDGDFFCTTCIPSEQGTPERHKQSLTLLKPPAPGVVMMTLTKADGSKDMIAVVG
jgi:hypothetical protein